MPLKAQYPPRSTAPLLSPDVDVLVLEYCGVKELGRCSSVSNGMYAAAAVAWKAVAIRKFPLLISIARAESQLPTVKPFAYASAFFCQLHLRVSRPRLDDLEELGGVIESSLSRMIITYELCKRRMGKHDYEYEPYFVWSGRMSTLSPELWTSERVPTELQRWWDETSPELRYSGGTSRPTGFRYSGSGPAKKPALLLYLTAASKTILLYRGELNFAYEGAQPLTSPTLYFMPEVAPESPRFAEPSEDCSMMPEDVAMECGMQIHPNLDIPTGCLRLECCMPDDVDEPDDAILRYASNLDVDWLADPSSDYRGEDEDDY